MRCFQILLASALASWPQAEGVDPYMLPAEGSQWKPVVIATRDGTPLPSSDSTPFTFTQTPDGIGAFKHGNQVQVLVNHEISQPDGGDYFLGNGRPLGGARISYLNINKNTYQVESAGNAYKTVYQISGSPLGTNTGDGFKNFSRFCSASSHAKGVGGSTTNIYLTGEEGGEQRAVIVDVDNQDMYIAPMVGRSSYENWQLLGHFGKFVAFAIGEDNNNGGKGVPFTVFVGEVGKSCYPNAPAFLIEQGLACGERFVFVSDDPSIQKAGLTFSDPGTKQAGKFVSIGSAYLSDLGRFRTFEETDSAAPDDVFRGRKLEDIAVNPNDRTQYIAVSSGREDTPFDMYGTLYWHKLTGLEQALTSAASVGDIKEFVSEVAILYSGASGRAEGDIRSPDNIDWAEDDILYITEDPNIAKSYFCPPDYLEASLYSLDISKLDFNNLPTNANPPSERLFVMNRAAASSTGPDLEDQDPTTCGTWESSGVMDASKLFSGNKKVIIFDVQAEIGLFPTAGTGAGGQLLLGVWDKVNGKGKNLRG